MYFTSTATETIEIYGQKYQPDGVTNITPTLLSKIPRQIHRQPHNPLNILKKRIESHFNDFHVMDSFTPVTTLVKNFDDLLFPTDHPSKGPTDTYYINKDNILRTHTSNHQLEVLSSKQADKYLLSADVYRRDEINISHYPIFHQMESLRIFSRDNLESEISKSMPNPTLVDSKGRTIATFVDDTTIGPTNPIQQGHHTARESELLAMHLKKSLESLFIELFRHELDGQTLQVRWIEAYFPFTSPSWEMEVLYQGKWLEVFGCGVTRQEIVNRSGNSDKVGWAFGLGLERIAMPLFNIPDIRLFWSQDPRVTDQFKRVIPGKPLPKYVPISRYPACYKDVSFWMGSQEVPQNEVMEIVRDAGGDLVEDVTLIDSFQHPKTKRTSHCYRINYRSLDRTLTNEECDSIHEIIRQKLVQQYSKILAASSWNKIGTCLEFAGDCFIWILGPILVVSATALVTLCAYVFYLVLLPWEYGFLTKLDDGAKVINQDNQSLPFSYYFQIALSIYVLLLIAQNYACVVFTDAGGTDVLRKQLESRIPHEHDHEDEHRNTSNGNSEHTILMEPLMSTNGSAGEGERSMRTCKKCNGPKPERTHHCSICKKCVKRLDHHCPWVGRCGMNVEIGHFNHRYFYLFMCYLLFAAVYYFISGFNLFWAAFVKHESIPWPSANWAVMFLFSFLLAGTISIALALLVSFHTFLILTAQTTIEFYENQYLNKVARARGEVFINEYDLGRRRNFAIFFNIGKKYKWWTILLPMRVPPLGDGTTWLTSRTLSSRSFSLDGSQFKDHITPI
ncbi:phenylalanine---tRNA ligase [Synchytrium microbalum]|uniref:Palmitoyltransferase n=1 Tax=Synchytrium microbalum TaxID=1806994 RepID=A0A507C892_9FUNG|nr:phenylalanine---tRNA ligase [Synchytrium microbalum]TPX35731.1 phenylalanine---tRNA ligase [Synchytrium microbalum]